MKHQRGNTLLISLVLLLIFTIVGLSSIGNVSFNQKMSTNYRESDLAFHAAEAALAEGEQFASSIAPSLDESSFGTSCSGSFCFSGSCSEGLCFNGSYPAGGLCMLQEPATRVHDNPATWSNNARDSQLTLPGMESAQFIVEFLCYVQSDPTNTSPSVPPTYSVSDWAYLFRITSYAQKSDGSARAMLQSTYKVLRN